MLESLQNLANGFGIATTIHNLFYCLIGAIVGTLIGVLPGIGPIAGIALLIPATFGLNATSAIIMLAGIYYGAMYGGSTTSILLNVPGETASVITCIDGYQMAQKGRAGPALAIAAIGSFIAGTLGIFGLVFLAPPLAQAALAFGPPEYFSLMIFGFIVLSNVTGTSLLKALMMATIGLIIGTIGLDPVTGDTRFSFGSVSLLGGIEFVAVAIGLFGIGEVLINVHQPKELLDQRVIVPRFRDLYPSLQDLKRSIGAILRGAGIGFGIGLVPGPAPVIATYSSYMIERKISKHPEEFGKGAIEGVAGPESANNSSSPVDPWLLQSRLEPSVPLSLFLSSRPTKTPWESLSAQSQPSCLEPSSSMEYLQAPYSSVNIRNSSGGSSPVCILVTSSSCFSTFLSFLSLPIFLGFPKEFFSL
jgi:putative tricarboxylic transport membrane protein